MKLKAIMETGLTMEDDAGISDTSTEAFGLGSKKDRIHSANPPPPPPISSSSTSPSSLASKSSKPTAPADLCIYTSALFFLKGVGVKNVLAWCTSLIV